MKNLSRHCDIFALAESGYTGKAKVTKKHSVTTYSFTRGFVNTTVRERVRRPA